MPLDAKPGFGSKGASRPVAEKHWPHRAQTDSAGPPPATASTRETKPRHHSGAGEALLETEEGRSRDLQARGQLFKILLRSIEDKLKNGSTREAEQLGRQALESFGLNHLQSARDVLRDVVSEIVRFRAR